MPMKRFLTRRSIRQYTQQRVSDELIRQLLVAANERAIGRQPAAMAISSCSPSAMRRTPWPTCCLSVRCCGAHRWALRLRRDGEAAESRLLGSGLLRGHGEPAAGGPCLGLGGVWIGVYPVEERVAGLHKLLDLPPRVVPLSALASRLAIRCNPAATADRYREMRVH